MKKLLITAAAVSAGWLMTACCPTECLGACAQVGCAALGAGIPSVSSANPTLEGAEELQPKAPSITRASMAY
jgi:hypothetical protein